jgi:hypothetical protein
MDLATYMQNPEEYKGNNVIITTDLDTIVENFTLYKGRHVELTAPFTYYGKKGYWTWQLFLEKDGKKIRCYEHTYRQYPGKDALYLLKRAEAEDGVITVRGKVWPNGIELSRLFYNDFAVNTDEKPHGTPYYNLMRGYY